MEKNYTETITREYGNGVETEKTVGQQDGTKFETFKVSAEQVEPAYREKIDENGRRRGRAYWDDQNDGLDDEDKAWLEILWRSPADTEERYHRAIQLYKKEKGLDKSDASYEIVKGVFGLDGNDQCVDYPTPEGFEYLKKAFLRPAKTSEELEEQAEGPGVVIYDEEKEEEGND